MCLSESEVIDVLIFAFIHKIDIVDRFTRQIDTEKLICIGTVYLVEIQ